MNLPMGPLPAGGEHLVQLIGRFGRRGIGADMTGLQTVSDGQQIHTQPIAVDTATLPPADGAEQGQTLYLKGFSERLSPPRPSGFP